MTKAQIFTVIYKMDGPHPLLPVFPGMRMAWAVSPRHRVLPASSEPEFRGWGWGGGGGGGGGGMGRSWGLENFQVSQVILLQPVG